MEGSKLILFFPILWGLYLAIIGVVFRTEKDKIVKKFLIAWFPLTMYLYNGPSSDNGSNTNMNGDYPEVIK